MADHACPDCGAVHREKPTSLKKRVEILEGRIEMMELRLPQLTWATPSGLTATGYEPGIPIIKPND